MSLRIWLPLTKDLRQQGLDNVTVTNNGATFNSAGKLGGCYSFDGSDDFISLNGSVLYDIIKGGSTPFSIAMWVYRADSTRAILFGDYSLSGGIGFNVELSTAHNLRFYWNGSPDVNTSAACTLNTWSHVAIVYDGTKICFYVNGSLNHTYTVTLSTKTKTTGLYYIGRDYRTGSTAFNGKLNDFRIYNHALSQMEVKELAKGLVLHYPLDRQGWGQENLAVNTGAMTTIPNVCNYRIDSGCSVTNGIGRLSGDGSWRAIGVHNGLKLADYQNKTVTISVDIKAETTGATYRPIIEFRTNNTAFNTTRTWRYRTINLTATDGTTIPTTEWKRFTCTVILQTGFFTAYDNTDMNVEPDWTNGYWGIHCYNHSSIYYNIKNIKLELGSIATPWCPNSSDTLATTMGLNSTTEYDCSGFCNNGTRIGTFSWTSDTPKYQISTIFSNNRIQCSGNFLEGLTTATLSAWIKLKSYHSERCMIIFANGRYLTVNSSGQISGYSYGKSPAGYHNGTKIIPLNTWTHVTVVWDASNLYIYVNGILDKTIACTGIFTNIGGYISIGQEGNGGRSADGYISDARIYATALSADDVKSLYQNSAYIDSSGNVYGAVHSEV